MRRFAKYLLCFFILGLFLSFSYAQKPSDKDETSIGIDKAKESTVRLVGTRLIASYVHLVGGTGFFVTPDKIVTNFHVAAGPTAGPIFAKLGHRETIWQVEGVWAFDEKSDIAILTVNGEGRPLALADVDTLKIGDSVYLAGFPYSREYKVVDGIIKDIRSSDKCLKTTLEAYPGNSGSPMINSKGEVIGIHVGHYYDARPSNAIKTLLESSTSIEPLAEWRKRNVVRAYFYHSQGMQKFFDGDYAGAIEYFTEAIKLKPNDPSGYNIRARAKKRMGDYAGAIEDFTQAIKSNPDDIWTYYKLAKLKHATKDYAGAIDDCNRVIKLEPDGSYAYSLRGQIKVDLEDYAGAIEDYTQVIKVSLDDRPGAYFAYIDRGNVKRKSKDYDGAYEDYNMAIKLIPENAYGYFERGLAKADLKDYNGAITDYDKAIELNNEYAEGYHYRGLAKEALGQHDAAKIDFDKAKEIDPEVEK